MAVKTAERTEERETEQEKSWRTKSILSISEDGMEAHLMLWPSAKEEHATVREITELLSGRQIVYGIQEEELERILREEIWLQEICVAKGLPAVHGKDGEFEFFIDVRRQRRPKIREDGSVDYSDYDAVTLVHEGQLLVRYHPAEPGQDGMTVKGVRIAGKRGQEKQPIKGKGFYTSGDKREYFSNFDGRAEYANGYMVVSHVLEIKGDVDVTYGNIDFVGDVKIYGDVITKMKVKASGFLTVEGHVEGAHLIAGKGVILKNGMQGGGIGRIDTSGDVEGKFFEQTAIRSLGCVRANAILNCEIEADEGVVVEGGKGALVGGRVRSGVYIDAAYIGNLSGVKTELIVGTEGGEAQKIQKLEDEMREATQEMYKTDGKIKILEEAIQQGKKDPKILEMKKQLLRQKIYLSSEINDKETQGRKLHTSMDRAVDARVVVHKQVYPGASVLVNGAFMRVPDVMNNITIKKKGEDACMFSNE